MSLTEYDRMTTRDLIAFGEAAEDLRREEESRNGS